MDRFYELVQMAGMYAEDGAWATAANRLRQAANLADAEAKRREDWIKENVRSEK
ncbi:hypothetical protein [Mameliella sp. LZ-28]|uniref:hypothetical protein n=1 Tax=Mameliella sp. LZ-28 TaxID=2484146 RepID=UPI00143F9A4A|nr:hypothetical protein [Mameliella sp. LZ-28]